jgi:hypothetical protein
MFSTTMKKMLITAAIATPLALSLGVVASPSSALAETTCDKVRGTIVCVTEEPVGNSDNVKTSTTSKKGSESSSHETESRKSMTNPSGTRDR